MRLFLNWKMYLNEAEALKLTRQLNRAKQAVLVFPSAVHLEIVRSKLNKKHAVGIQDVGPLMVGAATGENSALEAKKLGARYALVGHSEQRALGETNQTVAKKFICALQAGLIPVLCVGETLTEQKAKKTKIVVGRQLKAVFEAPEVRKLKLTEKDFYIAYEPVWAIGTGNNMPAEEAGVMHKWIRSILQKHFKNSNKLKVLYGGSVDGKSIGAYLKTKGISGALIGGASTKSQELSAILKT